jgi:hypothetical protein
MIKWKESKVLTPPTVAEMAKMSPERLMRIHELYHEAIANSEADPYNYGYVPAHWLKLEGLFDDFNEVVALGGNRSGKTSCAARLVVKAAMANPNATIWCFAQTNEVSISVQQSAVYAILPNDIKQSCGYTKKNGFPRNSAGKCSLYFPNGAELVFKAYSQFLNNDTILEGAELGCHEPGHVNIGAWCDEYLIGPELLEALRFRVLERRAKILLTFTPIDGFSEVVRDYIQGAKTVESVPAELLRGRKVPKIQHSVNRHAGIIYFHTKDNPFAGYKQMCETLAGRPDEEILTRAYGVATKSIAGKFPLFSRDTNVIKHEDIPKDGVTRYMVLDPAGRKNWFMCWIAVDASNTYYVYREWPDINVGAWAKWNQGKWCGGQGSKGLGYGIADYVALIRMLEDKEEIMTRLIDPRLGAAKYQAQNGASSIIEDLADAGMIFIPAPGLEIEDGLQALQSLMSYDPKKPIDGTNRPRFYVSDGCENIISALNEYSGDAGPDEAWKDPIDVIRYAAIDGISYVNPKLLKANIKTRGAY